MIFLLIFSLFPIVFSEITYKLSVKMSKTLDAGNCLSNFHIYWLHSDLENLDDCSLLQFLRHTFELTIQIEELDLEKVTKFTKKNYT